MFFLSRRRFGVRALFLKQRLVGWLRLAWLFSVFYHEVGSFYASLMVCHWPDGALSRTASPAHVLLISDPQVRYIPQSRLTRLGALRQFFYELTLRKSWKFVLTMQPDAVIVLGDMLASGRFMNSDVEYDAYFRKFLDILPQDKNVPTYFLPGNNDVGLNVENSRQARRRYIHNFGPLNQLIHVKNITFVLLDASGLVEEDYQRAAHNIEFNRWTPIKGGPVEFISSIGEGNTILPILFTHIPLHRPDTASCGPLRDRGTIRRGVGPGYQNTLGKKTTAFLLQTLAPVAVFSGDDRDYCEYTHVISSRDLDKSDVDDYKTVIREVTVKSFSPAANIRHPGFQLLSVVPPNTGVFPPYADSSCLLPNYVGGYSVRFIPLLTITLLLLSLVRFRTKRHGPALPLTIEPPHVFMTGGLSSAMSASKRDVSPRGTLPPTLRVPSNDGTNASTPALRATVRTGTPLLAAYSPRTDGIAPTSPDSPSSTKDSNFAIHPGDSPMNYGHDDFYHAPQAEYTPTHAAYAFSPTLAAPPSPDPREHIPRPQERLRWFSRGLSGGILPPPLRRLRRLFSARSGRLTARRGERGVMTAIAGDLWTVIWPSLLLWCVLVWRA